MSFDPQRMDAWAQEVGVLDTVGRLPSVTLPGNGVTITECAEQLFSFIGPTHTLFSRGKTPVALSPTLGGDYVLEPMKPSTARSFFERYASFWGWRSGANGEAVMKPVVMAEEMARALLDSNCAAERLPQINGLSNCAILQDLDGKLEVAGKGFSASTGLLVQKGEAPPEVPVSEAVEALRAVLKDFHFQTPGDHSRAMAAFLTPAMKMGGILRGFVPVDVAEADQSQSGKTYRQNIVCAIYGEKAAIVSLKKGGVGGIDESLGEKLVNGRPFVQLDNFRGKLDSPFLEALLTARGPVGVRVAHCREITVDPSRFFVLITSNGVEATRDLANRSSIIRIFKRSGVEFTDTLKVVEDRQAYYLGCVFAIIREWDRLGRRRTAEVRHDFREWCQTLDWIVQNICGMAPLMEGHQSAQERVSNPALTFLRLIAIAVERTDQLGLGLTTSALIELADEESIDVPGRKEGDDDRAKKALGTKLGALFKTQQSIAIDAFTVEKQIAEQIREDGKGTFELKKYRFTKTAAS